MELWIRSQDRERLIKVNTLFLEYNGDVDPTISPYRIVADKCIDLGIYKTKERALEVLDDIQQIINSYNKVNGRSGNYEDLDLAIKVNMLNYVYKMPKE